MGGGELKRLATSRFALQSAFDLPFEFSVLDFVLNDRFLFWWRS
jgi:hypothetical protein